MLTKSQIDAFGFTEAQVDYINTLIEQSFIKWKIEEVIKKLGRPKEKAQICDKVGWG